MKTEEMMTALKGVMRRCRKMMKEIEGSMETLEWFMVELKQNEAEECLNTKWETDRRIHADTGEDS